MYLKTACFCQLWFCFTLKMTLKVIIQECFRLVVFYIHVGNNLCNLLHISLGDSKAW